MNTRRTPRARPGTRRRLATVCGLVSAVALLFSVSACQTESSKPYSDRKALERYLRQAPGVPMVLPGTLPSRYVFIGPGYEQSRNGSMFIRTLDFRLGDPAVSQVIEICIAEPGSKASACVPSGGETQTITRKHGQYPVWIRPLGSDKFVTEDRSFWTDVPMTDNLDAVTWLT